MNKKLFLSSKSSCQEDPVTRGQAVVFARCSRFHQHLQLASWGEKVTKIKENLKFKGISRHERVKEISCQLHSLFISGFTESTEENMFCNISIDMATREYKIGAPVQVEKLEPNWKYSLSPSPIYDDKGNG